MNASSRPRRVLFIDHTAKLGGGEVALLNLLLHLDRERFEPLVVLFGDGPLRERLAAAGISTEVVALPASIADARKDNLRGGLTRLKDGLKAAAFVWKFRQVIRAKNIELVHTNSLKSDLLGGIAARLARKPVVWHVRDRIADDYLPATVAKVFRKLARWIPTAVIANSHATLETLQLNLPKNAGPSAKQTAWVVHDGTAVPDRLPPGRDSGPPVAGLLGRITPWKGQHVFIQAAAIVHGKLPEARFKIIGSALFGEDDYERQVRGDAQRLGLESVVEFTGFRADVDAVLADLEVLVHASTTGEPFGQVIIEGMAAGKPVIATRGGGVPEIVVDGETGLLVPMADAHALAEAMIRLFDDEALRNRMGSSGHQRVKDYFTLARVAADMESVFTQLTDRPKAAKHNPRVS